VILMDVNVLVYAHREDTAGHPAYRGWVEEMINGKGAYGVSEMVLSGFVRVVTHPKVFEQPTPLKVALEVTNQFRNQPQAIPVRPGPRNWSIFEKLLRLAEAKGTLVPEAARRSM
jgi:toxin-antitoxin system PIN domain toxin